MIAAHGFRVGLSGLLGDFLVPGHGIGKIIGIDKIVASIVGWVNIDHLHLAVISRLQQLQNLQVVTLDVKVLGGVPIYAFLWTGTQSAGGTLLGQPQAVRLALPLKLVLLKIVVDVLAAQRKQLVNVQLALADALREHRAQLVQVGLFYVHGKPVNLVAHVETPSIVKYIRLFFSILIYEIIGSKLPFRAIFTSSCVCSDYAYFLCWLNCFSID